MYELLKTMKKGTRLKISKAYRKYYDTYAFENCRNHDGTGLRNEEDAIPYFIRKAVAQNLKYTARFIHYQPDTGDGPGAKISITVGKYTDSMYMHHKHLEKAK